MALPTDDEDAIPAADGTSGSAGTGYSSADSALPTDGVNNAQRRVTLEGLVFDEALPPRHRLRRWGQQAARWARTALGPPWKQTMESSLDGTPVRPGPQIWRGLFPQLQKPFILVADRLSSPRYYYPGKTIKAIYLLAWMVVFWVMVVQSSFRARTALGSPEILTSTSSLWRIKDGCGLDGVYCEPFAGVTLPIRCPAAPSEAILHSPYDFGNSRIDRTQLVIGGGDEDGTYRADSWICAAAVHAGVVDASVGGCTAYTLVGQVTGFRGAKQNGIQSFDYNGTFPKAFRFAEAGAVQGSMCRSLIWPITTVNVVLMSVWALVATAAEFYWVVCVWGFLHVIMVTDVPELHPPSIDQAIELAMQRFLPTMAMCFCIWRLAARFTLAHLELRAPVERVVFYLSMFWVGTLINFTGAAIPIDRLVAQDMREVPGQQAAIAILTILIVCIAAGQVYMFRKHGMLRWYLGCYLIGLATIGLLYLVPGVHPHLHHYFMAFCLLPGTALQTRPSLLYQGFLLGWFINGAARWGFDSILVTTITMLRDSPRGTNLPEWLTTGENYDPTSMTIAWRSLKSAVDEVSVLVDDVERFRHPANEYSFAELASGDPAWNKVPHYFHLAYVHDGATHDYTHAATIYPNGTFVPAPEGAI